MRRRSRMIDRNSMAWLIYAAGVCLSVLLVSGMDGSDALFYAAGPLLTWAWLTFAAGLPGADFTARQIRYRLGRDRMPDALLFLKGGILAQLLVAAVLCLLLLLWGDRMAALLYGSQFDAFLLWALFPGTVFSLVSGPMRGFLDGCGLSVLSRAGLYPAAAATAVAAPILATLGRRRGTMAAQLLLNDRYGALYAGAGLALGISLGCFVYWLWLLLCAAHVRRSFLQREGGLGNIREERLGGIVPYCLRSLLLPTALGVLPVLPLLSDYRIGLHLYGETDRTGFGLHWWDGFAGVAYPLILGLSCVITVLFSRLPLLCAHELEEERYRRFRIRYAVMIRLSGYVSIAAAAFVFGAAKPIVQLLRQGLNAQARESAVLTLKLGSISIFLIPLLILVAKLFWECGQERLLLAAGAGAFVIQLLLSLLFMNVLTISVKSLPLAFDFYCLFFLLLLGVLGSRSILRHRDTAWLRDLGLILLSAAAADIPVCILNDFMTDEIIPVGSIILLLLIFGCCYILFSIFFGAVDLKNIDRLPGGRYIVETARLLHRA